MGEVRIGIKHNVVASFDILPPFDPSQGHMPALPDRHAQLCITSGGNGEWELRGKRQANWICTV